MTSPTIPPADGASEPIAVPAEAVEPVAQSPRVPVRKLAGIFAASIAACLVVYLAITVPGKWFSDAQTVYWGPRELHVTKGTARIAGDELGVRPADASGIVVVSIRTALRSTDYAAIEWVAIDVPENVDASLLWQTDYKPGQLNTTPLTVVTGRFLPVVISHHPAWIGNIAGLALAMKGPIAEPVRIRGVIAKPLSAAGVLRARAAEWLAFERWTGTSINTITGGADVQDLPLPMLLAAGVVLAFLLVVLLKRFRPTAMPVSTLSALAAFALFAWLVLDLRWTWNLLRQVDATAQRFAGKTYAAKRLAVEDGPLFEFVQKAKESMPDTPARIIVGADSHYFRGRAAYHLYPHNVLFDPRANTLPPPELLRPGDWFLVYHRKGVAFDAAQGKLRWDSGEPVNAELKMTGRGAALFQIR